MATQLTLPFPPEGRTWGRVSVVKNSTRLFSFETETCNAAHAARCKLIRQLNLSPRHLVEWEPHTRSTGWFGTLKHFDGTDIYIIEVSPL